MNNKVIINETWWVLSSHSWKGRSVGRATQKKDEASTVHCGYSPTSTFLVHVVIHMYGPCCNVVAAARTVTSDADWTVHAVMRWRAANP